MKIIQIFFLHDSEEFSDKKMTTKSEAMTFPNNEHDKGDSNYVLVVQKLTKRHCCHFVEKSIRSIDNNNNFQNYISKTS